VFNKTIGWNILEESYEALLGLGIIIDNNILKCGSQYSRLIHVLAMLTKFFKHISSLAIALRCFQDILSGSSVNKSLHLIIVLSNSSLKKSIQNITSLSGIIFNMLELIWQFWAELKDRWRACHKLSGSIHGQSSK